MKFLSTPSARRATELVLGFCSGNSISIHALREEGDNFYDGGRHGRGISIHALREEGDLSTSCTAVEKLLFLSTPSARRATMVTSPSRERLLNFYPRPPRGGRPVESRFYTCKSCISIHALRKEGDFRKIKTLLNGIMISIHALREEGDCLLWLMIRVSTTFLSTPSVRRATGSKIIVEQDGVFLSTPSARRATHFAPDARPPKRISIHALREEGDGNGPPALERCKDFYPRPPRGGRPAPC